MYLVIAVLDKALKIPKVRPSHEGQYRCQSTSESGEIKAIVWNVHVRDTIGKALTNYE